MKASKFFLALIVLVMAAILIMAAAKPNSWRTNFQAKGWVFGKDLQFAGERTWGYTGTKDTLVITGLDTTCIAVVTPKTTQIENLFYDIKSAGDTLFVTSDSAGTAATDKYSYIIIRNGYGATD